MFAKKKVQLQSSNDALKIAELEQKLANRDREVSEFIQNLYVNLSETFEQHEGVNSYHSQLEGYLDSIKSKIDQASLIGEQTNSISQLLLERGNHLHQETENMVSESSTGKQNVDRLLDTIYSLGEEVKKNSESMKDLKKSSDEIEEITNVINNIASQTNLLALNASIEAARAGEHGRGFAIVAEEVRKLAEITANSTNSIAELIKRIKQEIDNGLAISLRTTEMVNNSVQSGEDAMTGINKISDYTNLVKNDVNDIVSLIKEQQENNLEANSSKELFDEVHEALTAHIQEAAAVDEKLVEEINGLKKNI